MAQAEGRLRKPLRVLIGLIILGVAGFLVWRFFLRPQPAGNVIEVSGRIEGDDAAVAAKVAGRVREITVREGDQVKAGQVIASLDDDQVRAREQQAQSAVEQAEARGLRAQQQVAVLAEQLKQSELGEQQARLDAEGRVRQAEGQIAAAEANLAQAEASYKFAQWDEEKFEALTKSGDVPERSRQQARTTAAAQAEVVRAARKQVDVAKATLVAARANLANPAIRSSQSNAVRRQMEQATADVEAAQADTARARAQLVEAQANRKDLQITAPFEGTVQTRSAEPGEVVAAGTPIITLIDLNQVYLRGFIPEGQIGRVRVGQPARVYLDSDPQRQHPIEASVSRIDPQASFTPENTYFRNDRVKQVVGVKLQLKGAVGYAKPGLAADGVVALDDGPALANKK